MKEDLKDTLVEEGAAFEKLGGLGTGSEGRGDESARRREPEQFDVIVIGGGQAGLSVGYHLRRRKLSFVILDASERIGDAWRSRWDSLRLFTSARFSGLEGLPFPAPPHSFPTKDQMGDYLEAYAEHFELPVRTGTRVERLSRKKDGRFLVEAGDDRFEADRVVVAMASYQKPRWPEFARALDPEIVQIHAGEYRNPSQLRDGDVLVVGAGNSGAEIALELSTLYRTYISGRDVGQIPFRIDGFLGRLILVRLVLRVLFHRLLTIRTPMGRRMRPKALHHSGPLVRTKLAMLRAAGVDRVPRVVGVRDGKPLLDDGRTLEVSNVVWCTGFHPAFDWIDLPILDESGHPRHNGGIVDAEPGLYFVGLQFLYSLSSGMIHGVGRDAARIVDDIAAGA